jgi:N-acetylmuramate 1-kinase
MIRTEAPGRQHMSSPKQVSSNGFTNSAAERLIQYLGRTHAVSGRQILPLTPDASTRNYFRVPWKKATAIAAVYAERFDPETHPYLDVTALFVDAGIPIPDIYAVDGDQGIIVQEDLGDRQLFRFFETASDDECDEYKARAINLIARIQKATEKAGEMNSIASRLAFDEEKLLWELNFFREHYFENLLGEPLKPGELEDLNTEFTELATQLASGPRVLCHRDFHAANLMLDAKNQLRVIDYQDARMGPASYDLVSLLIDRQPCSPSLADLRHHRLHLLEERRLLGLTSLDPDEFAKEFRLMTVQRGLKAVGTFSCQTAVYGRGAAYQSFINPTLKIVLQAAEWLERYPTLRRVISSRLKGN